MRLFGLRSYRRLDEAHENNRYIMCIFSKTPTVFCRNDWYTPFVRLYYYILVVDQLAP